MTEIIDSHTHWGPSVSLGTNVTTEELLQQAAQSGVEKIVIFPFPSMALSDQAINEKLLNETSRIKKFIPLLLHPRILTSHTERKRVLWWKMALDERNPGLFFKLSGFGGSPG
jgi:Tat protein secretion system quality control protein TatD with DNase activity